MDETASGAPALSIITERDAHTRQIILAPPDAPRDGTWPSPNGDSEPSDKITTTLKLGREIFVSSDKTVTQLKHGESKEIQPGEFALMLTEEEVHTDESTAGLISMQFTKKMRGLVNITGFHIDPNNKGHLAFGVYNAGAKSQVVRRGDPLFSAIFLDLGRKIEPQEGNHAIDHLKSDWVSWIHGTPASLSALQQAVDKLRLQLRLAITAGATLLTAIIGAWLTNSPG